ncbi:MAG: NADH-quinone oxidoreductase subunit D, partial [Cyanobacteria bacterium REEB65]|nr:NADH-quinone oxidoreductase subunit D [Cyanobacteria bacterium REEB65]
VSAQDALSWGWTGPILRASGVQYDVRKAYPYDGYEQYDFEIPTGTTGDTYDRFFIRFYEMEQSARIIRQALAKMPTGPIFPDVKTAVLPAKDDTYNNIEGLMNHFKLVFEGTKVPAGEAYDAYEAANGELGFYVVADGSGKPYRNRCRPPSFFAFAAFPDMIEGHMVADAIATLGGINIIAGELDR